MKRARRISIGRWLIPFVVIACIGGLLPQILAKANSVIEKDRKGTIQVEISEADMRSDLKEACITTKLYQVATANSDGTYSAIDPYESLQAQFDCLSGKQQDKIWETILQQAMKLVDKENSVASVEVKTGIGVSSVLATGIYLIVAEPVDTKEYHYEFTPGLVALPNNLYRASGEGKDEWIYDKIKVVLKSTRTPLTGSLQIEKTLQTYDASMGEPLFVFAVEAKKDERVVYSDVMSLSFRNAGTKSATITGIPAGATVTVTEVYAGAGYQIISEPTVIIEQIVSEKTAYASFCNDTDGSKKYGTGIVNHFTYDGTGYRWTQIEDNAESDNRVGENEKQ